MEGVGNDPDGARKLFLDYHYACPKLLAILEVELNVLSGVIFRKNRRGFAGKDYNLTIPRGCERGTFKRLYNIHFHIFATLCKDSKTLQFISSLRKLENRSHLTER